MQTRPVDAAEPTPRPPTPRSSPLVSTAGVVAYGVVVLAAMLAALTVVEVARTAVPAHPALWYLLLVPAVGLAAAAPGALLARVAPARR